VTVPTRRRAALAAALLAWLALPGAPARPGGALAASADELELRVRILHTTDLHGSLAAWDDWNDRPAAKGLEKLATMIGAARADSVPTLLVDAGDALHGGPLVSVWREGPRTRPEPVVAAMNALGYDALTIGNHEFDTGRASLDSAAARASFAFLAANAVDVRTGRPAWGSAIVREFAGVRVGVLGLTTPALPQLLDSALVSGLAFLDPLEVARREIARLRGAERCDAVVAVVHMGLERDPAARGGEARARPGDIPNENLAYRLAYEVPGLDVVILGHTHQVIPSVTIGGALLTQAGAHGGALGRVELRFTRGTSLAEWKLAGRTASVAAVSDTVESDPALHALVAPYAEATREALDEVVARAEDRLAAPYGRLGDNPLWRLIHRCQLEFSGADVSFAALFDPTQAIGPGPVRRRDLLRLYPYDNTLGVVELTGADLRAALEHAASMLNEYVWDGTTPVLRADVPGFQFDGVHGVEYELDLTRPVGARVLNLRWKGKPLDPAERLKVVANSHRLAGGGDYLPLRRARRSWQTTATMPELLVRWARVRQVLRADGEPGWTLLPDHAGAPERPLVDRLVRLGVAPRAEVMRLGASKPARRVDLVYWLARAFDMRSARPSGAWSDVPDSLQIWLDGILARRVLGPLAAADRIEPYRNATIELALDWCDRTARAHRYALASRVTDPSFRRGLFTGVSGPGPQGLREPLTRAQWLGMLANLRFPSIRVLETTDFHGAILGGPRERRSQRPTGGSVALAAAVARERAVNPEGTVLLDGGDLFQGPMISNLQFGRPVVEQMNLLGYAASAVGNHEFDWGLDTLVRRVREMRFAALAANMVERKTGKRPAWARSDTAVLRRGVRVGIVGLAYPGTPRVTLAANVAHLHFGDDSTTAAKVSQRLRREGAALVLGVGHIPAETDSTRRATGDLARLGRVRTVDAWFGGHSHNVVDDRVEGRPILIAGAQGQYLAVADLVVDPIRRAVAEVSARVLTVYADGPVDSAWTARVARWNADVEPIAAEVIGDAATALHRRRPESTIGDFICDAMRADVNADIAFQNPGGMRADLDAGPITRGDVYAVMPFDNTIVTMELTGAQVKLALEQSLRGDRVTQVSGVRYRYDASRPALDRIVEISLAGGRPLEPERTYLVAVNNFMAGGGDQYDALGQGRNRNDTGRLIRDAMVAYVRGLKAKGQALDVRADGRIASVRGASD
jgi:2',3'-cyclic-nucleotide 2'-phosphodiesterase/3'-nucleotidase